MSTLYLIRHGQASFGKENYDRLSPKGETQSRILGDHLVRLGIRFDSIYSGTLDRHAGTVAGYLAACAALDIQPPEVTALPGLDEYDTRAILTALIPVLLAERPEMREHADRLLTDRNSFQLIFERALLMWASGNYPCPGLSTWQDFLEGVYGAADLVMKADGRGKQVALFTSGGPISALVKKTLGLEDGITMNLRDQIVNTSVSRFRCTESRIALATFNDYTHLELADEDLVTYR